MYNSFEKKLRLTLRLIKALWTVITMKIKKMTITNGHPSQKSIKRNTNSKQSNTSKKIEP